MTHSAEPVLRVHRRVQPRATLRVGVRSSGSTGAVVAVSGDNISNAVERLIAEAERLGGPVPYTDVLRLAERQGVTPADIPELCRELADADVEVDGAPAEIAHAAPDSDAVPSSNELEALERKVSRRRGRAQLLTASEEQDLTRRIRAAEEAERRLRGGQEDSGGALEALVRDGQVARVVMVERNQGLVRSVVETLKGAQAKLSFDDLVGEGQVGLLRAISKFDHTRGFKFSTYATYWIFQSITRALADKGSLIRVPVHMHQHLLRYRKTRRSLERSEGREPTCEEIAEYLGWPLARVYLLTRLDKPTVSLDDPIREHEGMTVGDAIPSSGAGPDQLTEEREAHEVVQDVLRQLPARERNIIDRRFGLQDHRGETLEEIGDDLGVTRERVRQIEVKGLKRLRHPLRSRRLWELSGEDGPCPDLKKTDDGNTKTAQGSTQHERRAGNGAVRTVAKPATRRQRKRRRPN